MGARDGFLTAWHKCRATITVDGVQCWQILLGTESMRPSWCVGITYVVVALSECRVYNVVRQVHFAVQMHFHIEYWQTARDGLISCGESSLSTCRMPIMCSIWRGHHPIFGGGGGRSLEHLRLAGAIIAILQWAYAALPHRHHHLSLVATDGDILRFHKLERRSEFESSLAWPEGCRTEVGGWTQLSSGCLPNQIFNFLLLSASSWFMVHGSFGLAPSFWPCCSLFFNFSRSSSSSSSSSPVHHLPWPRPLSRPHPRPRPRPRPFSICSTLEFPDSPSSALQNMHSVATGDKTFAIEGAKVWRRKITKTKKKRSRNWTFLIKVSAQLARRRRA